MRWLYPDEKEATAKARTERAMDAFYEALRGRAADLDALFSGKKKWDLPAFMHKHLSSIDEQLMWEFGPALEGDGHRLVITCEDERGLQPMVDAMVARAPKMAGWEFHNARPRESIESVEPTVAGRAGTEMPKGTVTVSVSEENAIDLKFHLDRDDEDATAAAYVAAEVLLGELTLHRWVGSIEVEKASRKKTPLADLAPAVDEAIASIKLPDEPYRRRVDQAEWSLFKLEPKKKQKDYAEQDDLLTAVVLDPPLFRAMHSMGFASQRFSRHGEVFAYVKIDGTEGLEGTAFGDREDIENAIDDALKDHGAVIGGGTGLRYTYVELACRDVPKCIRAVTTVLREGRIGTRSAILFHDAELSREWIGIYPDSPKPFGVD